MIPATAGLFVALKLLGLIVSAVAVFAALLWSHRNPPVDRVSPGKLREIRRRS